MAGEGTAHLRRRRGPDAIELLCMDHRRIERLFRQVGECRSVARRAALQAAIVQALTVQVVLEDEILHPALLAASVDRNVHRQAQAANECLRGLLRQIQDLPPDDAHRIARMQVLAGVFRHSVREKEGEGGLFGLARQHRLALDLLGRRMRSRRWHLLVGNRRRPRTPLTSAGRRSRLGACAPMHGIGPG